MFSVLLNSIMKTHNLSILLLAEISIVSSFELLWIMWRSFLNTRLCMYAYNSIEIKLPIQRICWYLTLKIRSRFFLSGCTNLKFLNGIWEIMLLYRFINIKISSLSFKYQIFQLLVLISHENTTLRIRWYVICLHNIMFPAPFLNISGSKV